MVCRTGVPGFFIGETAEASPDRVDLTMLESPFAEVAALLLAAALLGAPALRLRQPLILAFIVVGVLEGPAVLGWVTAPDQIDLLAKVGIALLLFVVGLKLDLRLVRMLGPLVLAAGLGQMAFSKRLASFAGPRRNVIQRCR